METRQKKSFIIIGTQRTGSSMVAATLHNHPKINCGWEWTLHMSPFNKISRTLAGLNGNFDALPAPHKLMMKEKKGAAIIGCRLLFSSSPKWLFSPKYNLAHFKERFYPFLDCLSSHRDIKIIHITREKSLDWLASLFMAKSSKLYINKEYPEELQITIPLREAVKRLKTKRMVEDKARCLKKSNPFLEISYEDIIANMDQSFTSLFNFLEVDIPDSIPTPPLKKQQKRPLSEVISNYKTLSQKITEGY
jgi:hypothetical protein